MLRFPVTRHHARHFPDPAADGVRVGIVLDGDDVGVERDVFYKLGLAVWIGDEVGRQCRVGAGENVEYGTVHLEKLSGGIAVHQQLGEDAGTRGVLRVTTGCPEGCWEIAGDVVHQVHATVVGVGRRREVGLGQDGAGMSERVHLHAQPFLEPLLQKRLGWRDGVTEDAQRGAAVDLLEALKDGSAERLVNLVVAHVVDAQRHDRLDAVFAHPLRRGQPRKGNSNMEGVFPVKVSQTIGRGIRVSLGKRSQQKKRGGDCLANRVGYEAAKRHESGADHARG